MIESGKFRYNIAIKKFCSNQSRKILNLIDYTDFNVQNEGGRKITDGDAKNNF